MCTFAALIPALLGASGSVAGYFAQGQAANAQAKYQNQVYADTGRIAAENYLQQTGRAGTRLIENRQGVVQALGQNQTASLQTQSTARVAAIEGGVEGPSVDLLLADFRRQEAQARDAILINESSETSQIFEQQKGLRADALSRIASARPGPVAGPSLLALGLNLAGTMFGAYDTAQRQSMAGPYNPNANLRNTGFMYRPLPFLGRLISA